MPNGGVLPSCFICQWARKIDGTGKIECQRHRMTVNHALHSVCPDLMRAGLTHFGPEQLTDGHMYMWIEIQYRTPDYPTLPQYYHELVTIAPISTYAEWSGVERQAAESALYQQKLTEFEQKYGNLE